MKKTAGEIETDVYGIVANSLLKTAIKGKVYREGTRPLSSKEEDVVITFLTGDHDEIQSGFVNINVYVPNVDNGSKVLIKNVARCIQVERILRDMLQSISIHKEYRFFSDSTIKSFKAEEIEQYFVSCKLKFKRTTF